MAQNGTTHAMATSTGDGRKVRTQIVNDLETVIAAARDDMAKAAKQSEADYAASRMLMLGMLAGAAALGIAIAAWISLAVSRGLGQAGQLARAVAEGDLTRTADYTDRDEIGDLVAARWKPCWSSCARWSGDVTARRRQRRVGQPGAVGQRRGDCRRARPSRPRPAEEASASMEQMAANIKQNAENAGQTEKIARQSAKRRPGLGRGGRARPSRRCRPSPRRSPSSRRSPARPTCWP